MITRRKNLPRAFARVSPVFALLSFFLLSALPAAARDPETRDSTAKRQSASVQHARAEDLRAALSSKPAEKRSLAEYKQVVASYRRVYLITPHANEVAD